MVAALWLTVAVLAGCTTGGDQLPSEAVTASTDTASDSTDTTITPSASSATDPPDLRETEFETMDDFLIHRADPADVVLVWRDDDGRPLGQLEAARRHIEATAEANGAPRRVAVILNAGLYQPGLTPAGLHVEGGVELNPINLNEGAGNFHLMPNGVFSIDRDGIAAVTESNAYAAAGLDARLAVQSGPMLTIDGSVHPAFSETSESRFVRNGVGVDQAGMVVFIQTTTAVTLWEFAQAFLAVGAADSLYLDGSIARMDAPRGDRRLFPNIPFAAMLAVTEPG